MDYGNFKDLNRKTFADKLLRHKAFDIAKDPKDYGYRCGFLIKKTSGSDIKNILKKELAE